MPWHKSVHEMRLERPACSGELVLVRHSADIWYIGFRQVIGAAIDWSRPVMELGRLHSGGRLRWRLAFYGQPPFSKRATPEEALAEAEVAVCAKEAELRLRGVLVGVSDMAEVYSAE